VSVGKRMSGNKDFYSIVVIGAMNPRVHTPGWYRLVNLIDDSEMTDATSSDVVTLLPISKWQLKDFSVICQSDRWEVQTTSAACLSRLRQMAVTVFDELLKHTPVNALGLNFNHERTIDRSHVGRCLAASLARSELGLRIDGAISGEMMLRRSIDDRKVTVVVRASEGVGGESVVGVANNYEYAFGLEKGPGFFQISDTISRRFSADKNDAEEQTAAVVRAINNRLES
jgi:hypothetical protein